MHGEKWTYNEQDGLWESSAGEKYYPSPHQYYTYDNRNEKYIDYSGKVYKPGSEYYGKYADPTGAMWDYAGTGMWVSSEKIYNAMTGEVRGVTGELMSEGHYGKYYDSQGAGRYAGGSMAGYYTLNPDAGGYSYYESTFYNTQNAEKYTDPMGQTWKRNEKGIWTNADSGIKPSDYYYGTYDYTSRFNYQGPVYSSMQSDFAKVGTTVTVDGQTYTVTADKGWTDASGNAVPPPYGQPSSAVGEYYGTYGAMYTQSGTYQPGWDSAGYGIYGGTGGAAVGTVAVYNGQTYTVTADKGWTDASGNAVAPPPGQPSSAV